MRFSVAALVAVLALAIPTYAGNIALTSMGATATCGGTIVLPNYPDLCYLIYYYPAGTQYLPSNPIDGDPGTEWVAPGGTQDPTLLIDLGGVYPVDSITISGVATPEDPSASACTRGPVRTWPRWKAVPPWERKLPRLAGRPGSILSRYRALLRSNSFCTM
jgi:hypothetical protein